MIFVTSSLAVGGPLQSSSNCDIISNGMLLQINNGNGCFRRAKNGPSEINTLHSLSTFSDVCFTEKRKPAQKCLMVCSPGVRFTGQPHAGTVD